MRRIWAERIVIVIAAAASIAAAPATAAGELLLGALQGGGRVTIARDPTDLLALPCVLAALWIARRTDGA